MAKQHPRDDEAGKPLPHCKALLICEKVTESPITGAITLHNPVEAFRLPRFPGPSTPFTVFLQLYDGIGRYDLAIEVHDLSNDSTVARTTVGDLEFPERLAKMEVMIPMDFVLLSRQGRYELVALVNGQEVGRQYFDAETKNE